jgi:rhodanese-related sulfurtransferase
LPLPAQIEVQIIVTPRDETDNPEPTPKHLQRLTRLPLIGQCLAILVLSAAISLAVNHLRPDGLSLIGDWSPQALLTTPDSGESLAISLQEAETLFFAQMAVFVDARAEELFRQGHIQGARNIPGNELESRYPEVMADVSPDSLVVSYCDGETCSSSKEVAFALMDNGFTQVRVLVNGWTVWHEAGLPIEK